MVPLGAGKGCWAKVRLSGWGQMALSSPWVEWQGEADRWQSATRVRRGLAPCRRQYAGPRSERGATRMGDLITSQPSEGRSEASKLTGLLP